MSSSSAAPQSRGVKGAGLRPGVADIKPTAGPHVRTSQQPTEQEIWALVERMTQSPSLSGSRALQSFLRYITQHTVGGTTECVKEQRIGCEVLGRRPDYDPALDNIVRVRAHELRNRIAKYFATSGAAERLIISIPRGSYVPLFQYREDQESTPGSERDLSRSVDDSAKSVHPERPSLAQWSGWIVALLLGIALLAKLLIGPARQDVSAGLSGHASEVRDFWSHLFGTNQRDLQVITADSTFELWQDVTGKTLNLAQYVSLSQVLLDSPDAGLRESAARRLTSTADLNIAAKIVRLSNIFGMAVRTQFARNVKMQELQKESAVLIGSKRSNPWVELLEPQMNFILTDQDDSGAPAYLNKKPRAGEQTKFPLTHVLDSDTSGQKQIRTYAHIALLENLSQSGYVLLLEGLNVEGTEAAGDMVTDDAALGMLPRKFRSRSGQPVQCFEAVLSLTYVPGGGFANTRVVAWRAAKRQK